MKSQTGYTPKENKTKNPVPPNDTTDRNNYKWEPRRQSPEQLQKLHEILDLVWRINEGPDHDAFYWLSGHVKAIHIQVHKNGFDCYKYANYDRRVYYLEENLDQIIKELEKWL